MMYALKDILDALASKDEESVSLVTKAYHTAQSAHKEQKRLSGEPYFAHVYATGLTLARIGADAATISAGFLHDTIEDGHLAPESLEHTFGKEILFLVEGVTKLGKLKYRGTKRHAESLRKLFVATSEDSRVILIKLADRLHNIQTLSGHPDLEKRKRIAFETLEIYAPIADRLGMGFLKGELEDAAFPHAYPDAYIHMQELMRAHQHVNEDYLIKIRKNLQKELVKHPIKTTRIESRIKRLFSLYQKLAKHDMDIEKVFDLVALRIIVETVEDCYRVLGIIHNVWRPLPGRIKDYIALPKPNGYQSIHTSVFIGDGGIAEIQIRTEAMDAEAEYGISAHTTYKEEKKSGRSLPRTHQWVHDLLEWQKEVSRSGEFLHHLKNDFFKNRVFVFTPKGEVVDLPESSTTIDFAYAIHTDIGNHISGAKVNKKLVPIESVLKNGDIVEILTQKNARPSAKWLKHARTTIAKKKIREELEIK